MSHINTCKRNSLETQTGQTGHMNDLELVWLQQNGATSSNLNDAWREVAIAGGGTGDHINDLLYSWLGNLGATQDSIADRWKYFWCDLEGALELKPLAGWTGNPDCVTTYNVALGNDNIVLGADNIVYSN